ncbi:hypothetical protein V8C86DRAFT_3151654 [Haematococcus lacustris]
MQPVCSLQREGSNFCIESPVVSRARRKLESAWSCWRVTKRKAIQAAFVCGEAPFRSQHLIWFTASPSNSNCDHYSAHGPNIIAASQLHPTLMPDLGLVMATITSSKGVAIVGVVAKHLQSLRLEIEQSKLKLMGPKWNCDEATTTRKTKKSRKCTGLEEEHTTEAPGPDADLQHTPKGQGQQHTPVAPGLGPALQLQHTPKCLGQGQQQQQQLQHTPVGPGPGPGPGPALALQLQHTSRGQGQQQQQQQHTIVATGLAPAPAPAPALQLHQLLQQQLLQPCPAVAPALQQQQHLVSGRSHPNVPLLVAAARRGSASGTVQPGVEEVASMGQGQVEKRAKTALALHAQDKSNIIINDALPSPAQPSPAQPSPAQPSPAQPSPAQPSPAQPSPAQPSPAQPSPAQPSPAQPSPAQPSPAQPSPAQPSPAQPSPAQPSPAQPSPAQPSPAQPSPAQPSPAQPSPAQPSPALPPPPPPPSSPYHKKQVHGAQEQPGAAAMEALPGRYRSGASNK